MPTRGIILGLGLALWVSLFTFFNDTVIRQPLMTGNLMPTSVYGLLVVLTLGGGWWAASRLPGGGLSRADLAVMVVLATAACAWAGEQLLPPLRRVRRPPGQPRQERIRLAAQRGLQLRPRRLAPRRARPSPRLARVGASATKRQRSAPRDPAQP